ncbi:MAG: gamma-glutamyl-gamma-aminobutyrate hydrolase family protein [Chthoniobacteraceae bacterium]
MHRVATWIRECDETNFRGHFEGLGVELLNARTRPVDLSRANGLLLTGGPDISAAYLRQPIPDPSVIEDAEPSRDEWEFAALPDIIERGLPIFAVCKGVQVLNVALGGTLHLDIPGHSDPALKYADVQPLRFSSTASLRLPLVNSSHHQALNRLGDGLEVEAWCATDDIVEQVRLKNYPYAFGVQYHPERGEIYRPLFAQFAAALSKAGRPQ